MRWLARIFAHALARRFAAVAIVSVLAWLGIGKASAADCRLQGDLCSQGEAYSAAWQLAKSSSAAEPSPNVPCVLTYSTYYKGGWIPASIGCGSPSAATYIHAVNFYFAADKKCDSKPSQTVSFLPVSGSTGCNVGCVVKYAQNADETSTVSTTGAVCTNDELKKNCPAGSYWNGYMAVCEPVDKPCPEGQKKSGDTCVPDGKCPDGMIAVQGTTPGAVQQGALYCKVEANECPSGTIKAPATGKCIPGEGQCAAGEARRENGTCGKDSDGDGKADEDDDDPSNDPDKDSASGGDSCDAPPSCSGSAIACIQVKIQWRIDCNTRRAQNISGGSCDALPVCTGKSCDAMEYAQLIQQWKSACALDKLAKKNPGEEGGDGTDGNGNGVPDALEGTGEVADAGDGNADVEGAKRFGIGVSTSLLSQDNIFGSGSCPQPPTFKYMGATVSGSDFSYWCQAMAILRGLILIFGAFTALKILMGWGF